MSEFDALSEFLKFISSEKILSKNTRLAYETDLKQFSIFCQSRGISFLTCELEDLRKYLAFLRRSDVGARSMARKLSSIRHFFKFLVREGLINQDPSELLSVLVKTKVLPKYLTPDEMVRLLESASGNTEAEIRDRALLELWYASGLRVSEVAGLKESDIKKEEGVILVRGKGGRERLVPVNALALEACEKYQSVRHETQRKTNLKDKGYFFLNRAGKKLTRQAVWKLVKKYAEKAGISRAVWPHMIRHSFATHVLQGGADLRAVQEMLGHRSITTTEVYTHLDIENLKVMQLKYHPRS